MLTKYDPDRAPDPQRWLAGRELDLMDIIERYHRRHRIPLPRPRLHAIIHLIVENHVALGDELPVAATLDRLMRDGLTRHDAIHAVGWVLANHLNDTLRTNTPADQEAYNRAIRELTVERWRTEAMAETDAE
jgi:hypothetical protein